MIILPDRHIPRARILTPLRWQSPSQRSTTYGHENVTRWRITARINDGHIVWSSWYDDRGDADAVLESIISGRIRTERPLWGLGSVPWHDGVPSTAVYQIHSMTFLCSYPGQPQTWTVPDDWLNPLYAPPRYTEDGLYAWSGSPAFLTSGTSSTSPANWNSANNFIETIGGGASGANGQSGNLPGAGGGAGGYAKATNVTLTPSTSIAYVVGAGGSVPAGSGTAGNAGTDTYFNGAHTLAAPAADCAIDLLVTNGASAGAITFSGFTVGSSTGSALTTTNTNKFIISIRRVNSVATYSIYALQ